MILIKKFSIFKIKIDLRKFLLTLIDKILISSGLLIISESAEELDGKATFF
ncbi:hypothetical protein M2142_002504 [Fusobacterium sp. PH5-29]|uniref:hypothetical protein n=1 Tax=Fusobacterium sp. PH5-29 TaxID=1742400 RepID=UPI003D1FD553